MSRKRKGAQRYRKTAVKGITQVIYLPPKKKPSRKLPPVVRYFTLEEIRELEIKMGLRDE
jgi:hypothetical protein